MHASTLLVLLFLFNDTATTDIYTLSLHDALPIFSAIKFPVGTTVDAMERERILQTLGATGNNKTRAAELLGISLKTLHNKLKEYGGDRAETEQRQGMRLRLRTKFTLVMTSLVHSAVAVWPYVFA